MPLRWPCSSVYCSAFFVQRLRQLRPASVLVLPLLLRLFQPCRQQHNSAANYYGIRSFLSGFPPPNIKSFLQPFNGSSTARNGVSSGTTRTPFAVFGVCTTGFAFTHVTSLLTMILLFSKSTSPLQRQHLAKSAARIHEQPGTQSKPLRVCLDRFQLFHRWRLPTLLFHPSRQICCMCERFYIVK